MENKTFHSVGASRAYYAIFQATKYLLEKKCFDYTKFKLDTPSARRHSDYAHGSIRNALIYFLLNNGFNKQDDLVFINEMSTAFKKLYKWRIQADYEDGVISKKNLGEAIERAEMFINKLKKYDRRG